MLKFLRGVDFLNGAEIRHDLVNLEFEGIISGLTVKMPDNKVRLQGEKSEQSDIYQSFLKPHLKSIDSGVKVIKTSISMEVSIDEVIPKTNSTIHMDSYGNFKMYLRSSGNNIFTIPYLLSLIEANEHFILSSTNPLELTDDSEDDTV